MEGLRNSVPDRKHGGTRAETGCRQPQAGARARALAYSVPETAYRVSVAVYVLRGVRHDCGGAASYPEPIPFLRCLRDAGKSGNYVLFPMV